MSESTSNPFAWLRLLSRDTSDIFFGCLTAIAASTFLALHLSVSAPHSDNSSRFLFNQWWASSPAHQFRRQLRWASMIVIAPELLVALAFGDWRAVSLGHTFFVRYGRGNVKSWTRTHASFANMSGFTFEVQRGGDVTRDSASYYDMLDSFEKEAPMQTTWHDITAIFNSTREKATKRCKKEALRVSSLLQPLAGLIERGTSKMKWKTPAQNSGSISTHRYEEQAESTRLEFQRSCTARTHESSIDHRPKEPLTGYSATRSVSRYLGITNIFSTTAGDTTHLPRNDTIILHLNAVQIVVAQALGVLDDGPSLTAEDIEDKGKSNIFIKGFAAAQLFWFATRIAIQLFRNQPLTQLELATFTYVLCALASYIFFWSKPQGVERPVQHRVYVSVTVRPITEEDITHLKRFGGASFLTRNFVPPFGMGKRTFHDPTKPIPTDISLTVFGFPRYFGTQVFLFNDDIAGIIAGMVFGALYCLGWNHAYPSSWEQWMWRASSILITASLIPYSVANGLIY